MIRIVKIGVLALLVISPFAMFSQDHEMQTGDTTYYPSLIPEEKQGLLKNMSMIANMRFAEQNNFNTGTYTGSKFVNEQFRLEIRGQVHKKVYFRFRDRYTRAQTSESVDNISRSTDMAYIRVDVTDRFNISGGKMCASWGAYEFDYNPIDVYEYSDIIEYADNFLTGVRFGFKVNPKHNLTFEILDSRTKTFNELYGNQPNKVEAKAPLALVANWSASLFNGHYNTIWSYAVHTEAQNTYMHYIALGNEFKFGKLTFVYDFKYSDEDLDRTGIISDVVPDNVYASAFENTLYIGHWVHLHYRLNKKWNLSMFAMLDKAKWMDPRAKDANYNIRDAWGYIPTLEFYPWENLNLRFYVNYVGRVYRYSDYAKQSQAALTDYTTGRFAIGFVSPLGIF